MRAIPHRVGTRWRAAADVRHPLPAPPVHVQHLPLWGPLSRLRQPPARALAWLLLRPSLSLPRRCEALKLFAICSAAQARCSLLGQVCNHTGQPMRPLSPPLPPSIQHERAQRGQGVAGVHTPVHPDALLPPCHDQIVGLFGLPTPNVLTVAAPLPIIRDIGLPLAQILEQLVQPVVIARLLPVGVSRHAPQWTSRMRSLAAPSAPVCDANRMNRIAHVSSAYRHATLDAHFSTEQRRFTKSLRC